MSSPRVPVWSFLAVEPAVKLAVKKSPDAFRAFIGAKSASQRASAFWRLFESIERHVAQRTPFAIVDRHRLAVQSYYALIDLSELNTAADRDIHRWLESILKTFALQGVPTQAAVSANQSITVA